MVFFNPLQNIQAPNFSEDNSKGERVHNGWLSLAATSVQFAADILHNLTSDPSEQKDAVEFPKAVVIEDKNRPKKENEPPIPQPKQNESEKTPISKPDTQPIVNHSDQKALEVKEDSHHDIIQHVEPDKELIETRAKLASLDHEMEELREMAEKAWPIYNKIVKEHEDLMQENENLKLENSSLEQKIAAMHLSHIKEEKKHQKIENTEADTIEELYQYKKELEESNAKLIEEKKRLQKQVKQDSTKLVETEEILNGEKRKNKQLEAFITDMANQGGVNPSAIFQALRSQEIYDF